MITRDRTAKTYCSDEDASPLWFYRIIATVVVVLALLNVTSTVLMLRHWESTFF